MRIAGFFLLLAGCAIVLVAIALLHAGPLVAFILTGLAVELAGLAIVVRSHLILHEDKT